MAGKVFRKIVMCLFIIIVVFLSMGIASGLLLVTTRYEVTDEKLPEEFDGFTIVQLADYHNATFFHEGIVKKIRKINPDMIVMTGDMITNGDYDFSDFIDLATELAEEYSVYFIVGNHEQALEGKKGYGNKSQLDLLMNDLSKTGVTILDNEYITLERADAKIDLYGLWFNLRYYNDPEGEYGTSFDHSVMSRILGERGDNYSILLTHNPLYFSTYSEWGANLILAGHIHGGMVRLPFVGGVFSPDTGYFPEYDAGVYYNNKNEMIVSRGIGNGAKGIRFYDCPELVEIVLKNK